MRIFRGFYACDDFNIRESDLECFLAKMRKFSKWETSISVSFVRRVFCFEKIQPILEDRTQVFEGLASELLVWEIPYIPKHLRGEK